MSKIIAHYADPNYSPEKAHEYYMKIRELKGTKKADTSEDDKQRELSTSQAEIDRRRKAELDKLGGSGEGEKEESPKKKKSKATKAKGDALRQKLTSTVKKDQAVKEAKAIAERLRLEKEKQAKIDSLPPIPMNVSAAQRTILIANRQKEIAKIVAEYDALYEKTTVKPLTPQEKEKKVAKTKKKKAALKSLKEKVNMAKESYDEAQKKIKERYDKEASASYEKILLKYAK